ncbi:MAG: sulfotransferase domain-containing protein [Marinosulfonomonas sp.]
MEDRSARHSKRKLVRLKRAVDAYVASDFSDRDYLELFSSFRSGWFANAGTSVSGDMSTYYSLLEPQYIEEIKNIMPDVPVMMIVRNPVDRLWSAFNMHLRRRGRDVGEKTPDGFHKEIQEQATLEELELFCVRPLVSLSSRPSRAYSNWSRYYDNVHVISFDEIRRDPRSVISNAASVAARKKINLPAQFDFQNSKERLAKARMLPQHRAFLYSHLSDELQRCQDVFPDIAANWDVE